MTWYAVLQATDAFDAVRVACGPGPTLRRPEQSLSLSPGHEIAEPACTYLVCGVLKPQMMCILLLTYRSIS